MSNEQKKCPRCTETKPHSAFYSNPSRKDSCSVYCKPCQRAYAQQNYADNSDAVNAKRRLTYRERLEESRGYKRQKGKEWREANPEKVKIGAMLSREKRRMAGRPKVEQIKKLDSRDSVCYLCEQSLLPDSKVIDHIIPVSCYGETEPYNLAYVHRWCNNSKSDKLPHELEFSLYLNTLRKMHELGHPDFEECAAVGLKNKTIIACDIDSTLYSFVDAFREVAKVEHNVDVPDHIPEWGFLETLFSNDDDFVDCVNKATDVEREHQNEPYPGAVHWLAQFVDLGFEIHYYTDRHHSKAESTQSWLKTHGFPTPENLHVCKDKKYELYRDVDQIVTLIDDRPKHLVTALNMLGLHRVFAIEHGYNFSLNDLDGIETYKDWDELGPVIFEYLTEIKDLTNNGVAVTDSGEDENFDTYCD